MKSKWLLLLFCFLLTLSLRGQTPSLSLLSPSGEISHNAFLSLTWTLGETSVSTLPVSTGWWTEGVQQPFLLPVSPLLPEKMEEPVTEISDLEVWLAPNPVKTILNLRIQAAQEQTLLLELLDVNGQSLWREKGRLPGYDRELNMQGYAAGLYLLRIRTETGPFIRTYRIIKVD